nr:hypothetical protein BaRGS_009796 [Batillaria attramentaria]KAG5685768.1 hypothetical protein BaRGS_028766 [Batillaria attramentaria]
MPVVKVSNSTSMMNDEIDDSTPFGPDDLTAVTPKLVYTTTEASDAGKRSPCNCILFADGFDFKDYPDPELGWEKLSATGDGITNGCRLRLCRRNQVCVPLAAEHNCLPLPDKYPCRLLPVKIYECESPNAYSEEEMLHMFVEKYIKEHGGYTTFAAVYNEVTVGDTEVTDSPTETTDADSDSPGDDD